MKSDNQIRMATCIPTLVGTLAIGVLDSRCAATRTRESTGEFVDDSLIVKQATP